MNKQCKILLIITAIVYAIVVVALVFNVHDDIVIGGDVVSRYADDLAVWIIFWTVIFGGIAGSIGLIYTSKETAIRIGIECDEESNKKHISL